MLVSELNRPIRSARLSLSALMALGGAVALSGCAPLNVQDYAGGQRPVDQTATVRPQSAQILSVDGAPVKDKCGGRVMKNCNLSLLPGLHSMGVQLMSIGGGGGPGYIAPTVATPGMFVGSSSDYVPVGTPVTVKYPFLAGHSYSLVPARICFTNPTAADPQARAEPAKEGLCLYDETTKSGFHAVHAE